MIRELHAINHVGELCYANIIRVLCVRASESYNRAIARECRLAHHSCDVRNLFGFAARSLYGEQLSSRAHRRCEINRATILGPSRRTGLILENGSDGARASAF